MIKNKEIIYREIIENILKKNNIFTQLALSKKFRFSLSTVNNSLKPLDELGILVKKPRYFEVVDAKKLLLYWASIRRLSHDVMYSTNAEMPAMKIEAALPKGITFAAFSAYRVYFNDSPADYSEVYAYADKPLLEEIKKRFPERKGPSNLIILERDKFISGNIMPLSQVYVDLWNIREWYAKDFITALEKRLSLW